MPEPELLSAEPLDRAEIPSPPRYGEVTLSDEARTKLEGWLKNHLEQIETALAEIHARFEEETNQFEGTMPGGNYPYPGAFRVNVPVTKKKVREIANRLKQAYLDSDPIWAINSPTLPSDIAAQVERGLDHQVDHALNLNDDLAQCLFDATLHGVGVGEPSWIYREDVRHDVVVYRAFDGLTLESLVDLLRFEQEYPNWREDEEAKALHAKLASGHDVQAEISVRDAALNRPDFVHIPVRDVRCYPHLNDAEQLAWSPAYGYLKEYTRQELEQLAQDEVIDDTPLGRVFGTDEKDSTPREDVKPYMIWRATIRYQLPGDDAPVRYKVWYERQSGAILRFRKYPWWLTLPDLVFFHTRHEEPGLFKRGIAWDLRDTHEAANVTFSLYLNGADMANSMRWKAKSGSLAEAHILQRRWSPHLTIPWKTDPNEIEPMLTPTSHLTPLVQAFELLRRQSDEDTQTTNLQSGRESPTDPNAPATKTIALLQQVEPNTKEYLRSLEPAFRQVGTWLLWLYYQGLRLGWITEVPGFPPLPPEMLPEIATQLHPRAVLFEFDRGSRLQADNMVLGWFSKLAPQAVPQALRIAVSHVNSEWAKLADSLPLEAPSTPPNAASVTPGSGTPSSGGGRLANVLPANGNGANPVAELAGLVR